MAKRRQTQCSCPLGGEYYCEWCTGMAARAGIILTSMVTQVHQEPAEEPEGVLLEKLRKLAVEDLKLLFYHTYSSKRSTPGWPDTAIIHPEGGILHLWELKATGGVESPAQKRWRYALELVTKVDARVLRPGDWPLIVETLRN